MKITIGEKGINKTWQRKFPKTTKCCKCKGKSRIAFVAHEAIDVDDAPIYPRDHIQYIVDLHRNKGKGDFWVHDCCCVAVYFCSECLNPTALFNQA